MPKKDVYGRADRGQTAADRSADGARQDGVAGRQEAGITDQTFYRWRKEYGGLQIEQAKKLKDLQRENAQLPASHRRSHGGKTDPEGHCRWKLLSPERRRIAVHHAREKGLSERYACRLVGQPRGTQRYRPTQRNDEDRLTQAIIALAGQYGRFGTGASPEC